MSLTVPALLLLAVPADALRVRLPVVPPVGGVLFAPLPRTLAAPLGIGGIACELLPAVIDAPPSLAFGPGTVQLIGSPASPVIINASDNNDSQKKVIKQTQGCSL